MGNFAQGIHDLKTSGESLRNFIPDALYQAVQAVDPAKNPEQAMQVFQSVVDYWANITKESGATEAATNLAEALASAEAAADGMTAALAEAARNLYYSGGTGGGGINRPTKQAGGLWNVPLDNYIAALHRGEMVLTADQARRYRAQAATGGNTYNDSASIYIDKYNQYSGADADGAWAS